MARKYKPGSFTKNFAWHETGFLKLHLAIRDGFHDSLVSVDRDHFRRDSGVAKDGVDLIPVNFYLHNRSGKISVDELVFQAIKHEHSVRFDYLALFALHLNRVGKGKRVEARPAMWANEFVRKQMWKGGAWRSSALEVDSLNQFIEARMDAKPKAREKCRMNYRHLFELCGFLPTNLPIINSHADDWIASAFFLVWDRHILDGGSNGKNALIETAKSEEIHKLLGVPRKLAFAIADELADVYIKFGCLGRFQSASPTQTPKIPFPTTPEADLGTPEEDDLSQLFQDEADEAVERRTTTRNEQKRNTKLAAKLKKQYKNICQFCDEPLEIAKDLYYTEAAHIKPLGKPHDGPDKAGNILVLCPNHHLQFDRGALRIIKAGDDYTIRTKSTADPLAGKAINLQHELDEECVAYHYDWHDYTRA